MFMISSEKIPGFVMKAVFSFRPFDFQSYNFHSIVNHQRTTKSLNLFVLKIDVFSLILLIVFSFLKNWFSTGSKFMNKQQELT